MSRFELETASIEDKIMHYLVKMRVSVAPNIVKANRIEFDIAVKSLGDKGYVTYTTNTHELFNGETENINLTKKGEEYYNNKFSF